VRLNTIIRKFKRTQTGSLVHSFVHSEIGLTGTQTWRLIIQAGSVSTITSVLCIGASLSFFCWTYY